MSTKKKEVMRYLICILSSILLICCNTNTNSDLTKNNHTKVIVSDPENSEVEFVNSAEYIFLSSEKPIGKIGRLFMQNNKIIIQDEVTQKVLIFNSKGDFLFEINKKGKGSGEYSKLNDLAIDKNKKEIIVLDVPGQKLLFYSLKNGDFIGLTKIKFRPTYFSYYEDAFYFHNPMSNRYIKNKNMHYSLIKTNRDGQIEEKYLPINSELGSFRSLPNKAFFYGDDLLFIDRYSFSLKNIIPTGINNYFEIYFPNNRNYQELLHDVIASQSHNVFDDSNIAYDLNNFANTEKYISFTYCLNRKKHYVFFDKNTGDVIYNKNVLYPFTEQLLETNVPIFYFPTLATENKFVSIIPPNIIRQYFNPKNPYFDKLKSHKDFNRFTNVLIEDNPIIALYEINFN